MLSTLSTSADSAEASELEADAEITKSARIANWIKRLAASRDGDGSGGGESKISEDQAKTILANRIYSVRSSSKENEKNSSIASNLVKTSDKWLYAAVFLNLAMDLGAYSLVLLGASIYSWFINHTLKQIYGSGAMTGYNVAFFVVVIALVVGAIFCTYKTVYEKDRDTATTTALWVLSLCLIISAAVSYHSLTNKELPKNNLMEAQGNPSWYTGMRPDGGGQGVVSDEDAIRMISIKSITQPSSGEYYRGCSGIRSPGLNTTVAGSSDGKNVRIAAYAGNFDTSYGMPSQHCQLWGTVLSFYAMRVLLGRFGNSKITESLEVKVSVTGVLALIMFYVCWDRANNTGCNSTYQVLFGSLIGVSIGMAAFTVADSLNHLGY